MLPPLGNILFEATIPLSVTLIMSQFEPLTVREKGFNIAPVDIGIPARFQCQRR
jgi:hypothetical protein